MTTTQARAARPLLLPPNQFPHFYRGGQRIAALRGLPVGADDRPEDWVASTTTRFGEAELGLSRLGDGGLLRAAVAADPVGWLGPWHVRDLGPDLDLLVKLLDTGQRLVVHAHPDRRFAAEHLGCRHGKTEAWVVLECEAPAQVHLGFRREVSGAELRRWVEDQDREALLGTLNVVPVVPGDVLLVPAGLPHAIGAGILVVELQEPTDFSVLMEWQGFDLDGAAEGHLRLGFDLALQCVDRSAWSLDRLQQLCGPADDGSPRANLLPPAADPFFRAERLRAGAELDASVAVLVVSRGAGTMRFADGADLALERGDTVLVPYAAGPAHLDGDVEIVRARPPDPTADQTRPDPTPRGAP